MITFYGLSIAVPGCTAGDAVGTVFSPYDHRLFVDRSAFYSWFRTGRYRGYCHWPVLLRVQRALFGRRSLAVIVMTLLLILLFILPVALLVNSTVDNSGPVIQAITSGEMTPPTTGG